MISEIERKKEINRYKNLIRCFPDSDRRTHWETLIKALESE